MKGISTILAMIMIVIIVVALIGLTYTFAVGLFSTTTTTATGGVNSATQKMDKRTSFIGPETCKNSTGAPYDNWVVTFTIRHDGNTYKINDGLVEMTALLDSRVIADANTSLIGAAGTLGTTLLSPGDVKSFTLSYSNATGGKFEGVHTLSISAPAGTMPPDQIVCLVQ